MTDNTKKYKRKANFCKFMSIILIITPLIIYSTLGFINGSIGEKTALGLTLITCLIFVGMNIVFKYHIRSTIWILLLGIQICISNITSLLIIISTSTMLDEFMFSPLHKKYKNKYIINNEIDKRN
jgi:hypothetical protein